MTMIAGSAVMPEHRRLYPTNLSDEEWALLTPLLEKHGRLWRPPKWPQRRIADAIFYRFRSGCPWRLLSREYPRWQTVHWQLRPWRIGGTSHDAHDRLRRIVRVAGGWVEKLSTAVLDRQAARATGTGGLARGHDGAKRTKGH
jgi:transposase